MLKKLILLNSYVCSFLSIYKYIEIYISNLIVFSIYIHY